MWVVFIVNVGFLVYCASLFRKKLYNTMAKRCCKSYLHGKEQSANELGNEKNAERELRRSTSHTNPLVYRRSFVQTQVVTNPFFSSSITTNPVSSVARRRAVQSNLKARTSLRLSRLRNIKEAQRSKAVAKKGIEMSNVEHELEDAVVMKGAFVDNPMLR